MERTLLPCARYKSRSLGMLAMSATRVSNSSGQAFDPECSAPCRIWCSLQRHMDAMVPQRYNRT